jgi:predicted PurR-regulated permease PerM
VRESVRTDTFRNLVLGVLLAIMIGWVLSVGRGVILPVVASLIVAYIILGLADGVGRLPLVGPRIPSPARHLAAVLVIGAALFALMSLILSNVGQVAELAPEYQRRLLATIQAVAVWLGVETEPTWETLRRDVLGQINFQRVIGTTVASVSSLVATFIVVLIYAGFLLMEKGAFARKVSRLSDDPVRVAHVRRLIGDINSRIGTYLVMKTGINVLLGSLSYIVMRVAGIEFAGFWALLIGLFNYIPYVGSFLGVFFPVALSVLQFGALGPVVVIALALSATQVLVGNFIEPWLMGTSLNLSPFVILVSLVTWSSLWGLAGAILAVPITAILVIILSEFPGTRPIAVLLSKDGNIRPVGDHFGA